MLRKEHNNHRKPLDLVIDDCLLAQDFLIKAEYANKIALKRADQIRKLEESAGPDPLFDKVPTEIGLLFSFNMRTLKGADESLKKTVDENKQDEG